MGQLSCAINTFLLVFHTTKENDDDADNVETSLTKIFWLGAERLEGGSGKFALQGDKLDHSQTLVTLAFTRYH